MREVIAKVIENALADAISECRAHGDEGGPYPSDYQEAADAVLDALMEPTPEMLEGFGIHANRMRLNWQAMLTAARSGRSGER